MCCVDLFSSLIAISCLYLFICSFYYFVFVGCYFSLVDLFIIHFIVMFFVHDVIGCVLLLSS